MRKKGKNLKIVFEYILKQIELEKYKNIKKIITIDADGTHDIKDVIKLDDYIQKSNSITVGARNFKSRKISISDKIGNLMTRNIIKQIYKIKITDTQSMLVAIPIELLEQFEKVSGGRCEYKTELLLKCLRENIKINEIRVKSIKPTETSVKYKNAIMDSIRIYWIFFQTFVKYLGSSLSVALLDFLGFIVFVKVIPIQDKFWLVLIATILARIISATTNFFINRKVVFCSADDFGKRAAKFFTVVLFIMVSSGIIVAALSSVINISERIIKIVIDALLFFVSYELQKKWVFKNK